MNSRVILNETASKVLIDYKNNKRFPYTLTYNRCMKNCITELKTLIDIVPKMESRVLELAKKDKINYPETPILKSKKIHSILHLNGEYGEFYEMYKMELSSNSKEKIKINASIVVIDMLESLFILRNKANYLQLYLAELDR